MTPSAQHPELWAEDPAYLSGIQLFNQRQFWESHEAWEEIWLHCDGIQSEFLQGLIQAAAALLKYQRNEFPPAQRLSNTALGRLQQCPDYYMGLNVRAFEQSFKDCMQPVLSGHNSPLDGTKIPQIEVN
jgi:predicted metal-dependent hydrolase